MKKLPARHMLVCLPMGVSLIMTCLVSGVATYRALGYIDGVFSLWMQSWMISWLIAFPTMYFMLPVVRRMLATIIEEKK